MDYRRISLSGPARQGRGCQAADLDRYDHRSGAGKSGILAQLTESGAITPVIDRTYPLADAADAIRRLAAGHAVGKGIITI